MTRRTILAVLSALALVLSVVQPAQASSGGWTPWASCIDATPATPTHGNYWVTVRFDDFPGGLRPAEVRFKTQYPASALPTAWYVSDVLVRAVDRFTGIPKGYQAVHVNKTYAVPQAIVPLDPNLFRGNRVGVAEVSLFNPWHPGGGLICSAYVI